MKRMPCYLCGAVCDWSQAEVRALQLDWEWPGSSNITHNQHTRPAPVSWTYSQLFWRPAVIIYPGLQALLCNHCATITMLTGAAELQLFCSSHVPPLKQPPAFVVAPHADTLTQNTQKTGKFILKFWNCKRVFCVGCWVYGWRVCVRGRWHCPELMGCGITRAPTPACHCCGNVGEKQLLDTSNKHR